MRIGGLNQGNWIPTWQRVRALVRGPGREEGQTLIEFAMACLVLIPVLFGSIEACLGFYTYNFVADAAREATRWAMVRGSACRGMTDCNATPAQVQNYVQGLGYPGLTAGNLATAVIWSQASALTPTTWTACGGQCNQPGNQVRVTVQYNFSLGIPFVPTSSVSIASTSSMVISQ